MGELGKHTNKVFKTAKAALYGMFQNKEVIVTPNLDVAVSCTRNIASHVRQLILWESFTGYI